MIVVIAVLSLLYVLVSISPLLVTDDVQAIVMLERS
jgi:hypothetical protein